MGKYINRTSKGEPLGRTWFEKVSALLVDGAVPIQQPTKWEDNIVCVVDNGVFGAAGYCYDKIELKDFSHECGRTKAWFKYEHAKALAEDTV